MTRVLVVDDEPALRGVVEASLGMHGFGVTVAPTGRSALDLAATHHPDLVLLDLGLPDLDGIDVCRLMRRFFSNPIIVLSGDGAEDRKIEALDAGADDYVTKPFSMPELLARMRVAIRHRDTAIALVEPEIIVVGDLTIDLGGHIVRAGADELELTRREFNLASLLARNAGNVVPYDMLLRHVWNDGVAGTTGSLRVHVTHLRKKLGVGPRRPRLETVAGVGYSLVPTSDTGRPAEQHAPDERSEE